MSTLDWLSQNSAAVQALTGIATAIIWLVYLQLLISGIRHQRRTDILILVGAGRGTSARCFVSNLGMDPIYVASLAVRLDYRGGSETVDITDVPDADEYADPAQRTHQGPMKPGESRCVGILNDVLLPVCEGSGVAFDDVSTFHIRVSAFTASDSVLVAAERGFRFDRSEGWPMVRPLTLETRQIRSLIARRRIKRQLQAEL